MEIRRLAPRAPAALSRSLPLADAGEAGLDPYRAAYPDLASHSFDPAADPADLVGDADLVIVHEWNEPALVAAIGPAAERARAAGTALAGLRGAAR